MYLMQGSKSRVLERECWRSAVVDGSPGRELQPPPPPGPLQSGLRKRVQAAEGVDCGSRPPPEGAGATTGLEKEERGTWCKNCQVKLAELRRQALKLVIPGSIKDPGFSAFIFDKLQVPDSSKSSRNESESRCEVCATHLNQLKKEAIQMVHTLSQASTQDQSDSLSDLAVGSASPKRDIQNMVTLSSQRDWPLIAGQASKQPGKSGNIISGTERRKGVGWPQGTGNLSKSSIQVTVGPSGLSSALSSVTIQAQQYLEGMWNISRVNNFLPNAYLTQTMTEGGKEGSSQEPLTPQNSVSQAWAASTPAAQNSLLPGGIPSGASAAASFFIRAAQKLNLSSKRKKHHPGLQHSHEFSSYTTDFSGILQVSPPPAPPCLLRAVSKVKDNPGIGKVKVMVRICPSQGASDTSESMSFLKVDSRKKQITLYDPSVSGHISSAHRRTIVAAPKMFAFDAVFTQDASQAEVCSGTVAEVIQSVVNGADGCIFCFGHVKLGKSYTMIGKDNSTQNLGIIPCAISWLFKLINERKEKTGTRFSVRVSAVEIWGKEENLRDLLSEAATGSLQDGQSPGVYLREDPICGTQLQNQSELRAPTAEKAAYFLDAAIASRRTSRPDCDEEERRNSHMLFTLHIYQYRMEKSGKGGMSGGRSRLHLIDLGSCEKVLSKSRDGSGSGGLCLSLSALGNVILALVNGAKHIPYKDSKLTMLLRESLGNINCRTTMITHISGSPANYTETLTSIQLAARIHRMRKKKSKYASSSSGGESSCEEGRIRRPPHLRPFHPRTIALDPELPALGISSDPDYSSSSEQSCDTVIYVGPDGAVLSDRDLTDNEGPPEFVPIIPSLNKRYDVKRNRETATGGKSTEKDYFKCNTFAELQERLECIDGSEAPLKFCAEQGLFLCSTSPISLQGWMENGQPTTVQDKPQSVTGQENGSPCTSAKHPLKEAISPKKRQGAHSQILEEQGNVSPAMIPPQSKTTEHLSLHTKAEGSKVELSSDAGTDGIQKTITASSNVPRSDCPKAHEQTAGAPASVVREKSLFYRRPLPSPAPPPPQTKDTAKICSEFNTRCVVRTPPVGMSHQMSSKQECGATGGAVARCRGTHSQSGARDVNHLRSALRTGCIDRDMLTTTVTLQQPVELNGEDELVFTMVEELSFGEVLESGRPASIISFNSDCSLQALASGSRPVSIISSINDDFEAYTSPAAHAGVNIDIVVPLAEAAFCSSSRRSSISSWLSEVSICTLESECAQSSDSLVAQSCCSCGETSLGPFNLDSPDELQDMTVSLPHTPKSTLNDSGFCFSELENESAGSSKLVVDGHKSSDALGSPKAALSKSLADATNSSVMKSGTPAHSPGPGICEEVPISHCSLPTTRKVKPTSSVSHSCSTVNCADAQRQENKLSDPWLRRTNSQLEPKAGDQALSAKSSPRSGNSIQAKQQMKTSQNNGTLPRLNKSYTTISCTHRVVDGCEMATKPNGTNDANVRKCEGPGRAAQVKKGTAAVATMPIMHTSADVGAIPKSQQDYASITGSLKSTAGKKTSAPKASMLPRLSGTPPAPPVRKSSLDLKNRAAPLVGVQKSTASDTIKATSPKLEDEIDGRPKAASCVSEGSTNKPANGKPDQAAAKNASNPKSKLPKLEAVHRCGSQASLERCDSLSSVGSKNGVVKESGNLGNNNGRTGRSVPRLGVSPSVPAISSPPIPMVLGPAKSNQTKCASNNKAVVSAGKCRSLSTSGAKVLTTSVKSLTQSIGRSSSVPPNGKTIPRSAQLANCKPGKGTIMGTKQAVRAANSRVSELASGASSGKMGHLRGSTDSDSGNDSGVNLGDEKSQIPVLPSPYSKITAPRRPQRYSSGHGSDNSSVLSGELPPAMGRTALFYHSGGSSGYESMIRDSEATGSASSAHDSMSESGMSSSGRNRSSKSPKKRTTGIQRRRLIPAPLPDASSLGRKPTTVAGQWVDLPPLPGTLKESFEIKVYEIDDVERLQRHRQEENEQPFEDVDKGLLYFNTKLKILEKRQQRIRELKAKHEVLKKELEDTKDRLMMDPDKWNSEFEVDPDLDKDSLEYLEALEEVTEELEQRVNLCKSRIMMVTCFDIGVIIDVHDGPREVQV